MNKEQRWYAVEGNTAYIYDAPFPEKSQSISIVNLEDLKYYRTNFKLERIWQNAKA